MSSVSPLSHPLAARPARAPGRPATGLLRTQLRLFLREPLLLVWAFALPLLILVAIGASAGDARQADLGGIRVIDAYVPTLAVFALAMVGLNALPPNLANDRERGVLRRLATTPVSPAGLIRAQLVVHAGVAVVSLLLVVAVGRVAFGVGLPHPLGGFVLTLLLAGSSLLGIGVLLAAVAPSARAANAMGAAAFFPAMFLGGLWIPRETMSPALRQISDLTPVGAAVGALQDVTTGGSWPSIGALAVMLVWGVVAAALAVRLFRWQ